MNHQILRYPIKLDDNNREQIVIIFLNKKRKFRLKGRN